MTLVLLDIFGDFAKGINFNQPVAEATNIGLSLIGNPTILIIGIVLIAVTIFLFFFLKKIITNSILGGIIWFASIYVFHVQLPVIPSFVISVLFGPAGIGAMLLLKFFGLLV
ncbi:Uncharacterised protein [uncultured archaeon]|nr:Uncharacterised protein [uncultured archaeon]